MNDHLKSSIEAADVVMNDTPLHNATLPCPNSESSWVTIELVGEDGTAIANQRYRLILANGEKRRGKLDAQGRARVDGIPPGDCRLSFPDLDREAWERIETTGG